MDYSLEQIDEIRRHLLDTKPKVAVFVGAGCSSVLQIPKWNEMLIALNKEFDCYPSDADVEAAILSDDYPKVAANIRKKAGDSKKYHDTIRRYATPTACNYTSLHIEIVQLSRTIVTTNYDHALEDALEALKRATKTDEFAFESHNVGEFALGGLHAERKIFHLHGDMDRENLILDETSYDDQYGEDVSDPVSLLNNLYKEFHLLFIGYSFRDSFVVNHLKKLAGKFQKPNIRTMPIPKHFCIMAEFDLVHFCPPSELTGAGFTNAQELIDEGILLIENTNTGQPPNFVFSSDAMDKILASKYDEKQKKQLGKLFVRTSEAVKRHEEFELIGIKPILFKGWEFLRIETILQNLMRKDIPFAPTFVPN